MRRKRKGVRGGERGARKREKCSKKGNEKGEKKTSVGQWFDFLIFFLLPPHPFFFLLSPTPLFLFLFVSFCSESAPANNRFPRSLTPEQSGCVECATKKKKKTQHNKNSQPPKQNKAFCRRTSKTINKPSKIIQNHPKDIPKKHPSTFSTPPITSFP